MSFNVSSSPHVSVELWLDGVLVDSDQFRWKVSPSSIQHLGEWTNSNFGGDHFNASRHIVDWSSPKLDDSSWPDAHVSSHSPSPNAVISEDASPPTRRLSSVSPTRIRRLNETFVVEMEKLFAGWVELTPVSYTHLTLPTKA